MAKDIRLIQTICSNTEYNISEFGGTKGMGKEEKLVPLMFELTTRYYLLLLIQRVFFKYFTTRWGKYFGGWGNKRDGEERETDHTALMFELTTRSWLLLLIQRSFYEYFTSSTIKYWMESNTQIFFERRNLNLTLH